MSYFIMTRKTQRNNVKPMFKKVAPVMVLLSLFATFTFLSVNWWQLTRFNSNSYHSFGSDSFRMVTIIIFLCMLSSSFAFFGLVVTPDSSFAFFTLTVSLPCNFTFFAMVMSFSSSFAFFSLTILLSRFTFTYFTLIIKTIFMTSVFVKIGNRFNFFALRTMFSYDCFRHGYLSPVNSCCLGLIIGTYQ